MRKHVNKAIGWGSAMLLFLAKAYISTVLATGDYGT